MEPVSVSGFEDRDVGAATGSVHAGDRPLVVDRNVARKEDPGITPGDEFRQTLRARSLHSNAAVDQPALPIDLKEGRAGPNRFCAAEKRELEVRHLHFTCG